MDFNPIHFLHTDFMQSKIELAIVKEYKNKNHLHNIRKDKAHPTLRCDNLNQSYHTFFKKKKKFALRNKVDFLGFDVYESRFGLISPFYF